jgi:hypothetical protein
VCCHPSFWRHRPSSFASPANGDFGRRSWRAPVALGVEKKPPGGGELVVENRSGYLVFGVMRGGACRASLASSSPKPVASCPFGMTPLPAPCALPPCFTCAKVFACACVRARARVCVCVSLSLAVFVSARTHNERDTRRDARAPAQPFTFAHFSRRTRKKQVLRTELVPV